MRFADQRGHLRRHRLVGADSEGAAAERCHLGYKRFCLVGRSDIAKGNVGAIRRKPAHDGSPDAARSAGHERGLADQGCVGSRHHLCSFILVEQRWPVLSSEISAELLALSSTIC